MAAFDLTTRRGRLRAYLDYLFERYLADGASGGRTFSEWIEGPGYDPAAIKADYQSRGRKSVLADLVPRE